MILKSIHLENYRGYRSFDCEFDDRMNLIIGDNGAGKTSLLSAIVNTLYSQMSIVNESYGFSYNDVYTEYLKSGDATYQSKEYYPLVIEGAFKLGDNEFKVKKEIKRDQSVTHYGERNALAGYINDPKNIWPVLSYQRFDREWRLGGGKDSSVTVDTGLLNRKDGYKYCLLGQGQDEAIQRWCLKMSILEFEKKREIKEFQIFKSIIQKFMQTVENDRGKYEVGYSIEYSSLVFIEKGVLTPIYELSTGYKALLSMIMDIAYRIALLNPDISEDYGCINGIVIVDEIDAHLHPKWQWNIIEALQSVFPGVQFIVATHSPIVISSAKDAHIISLEEDGSVVYPGSAYGYNVADVLDLRQDSIYKPKLTSEYMDRLEKALDDGDITAANTVVSDAMNEFGMDSPVYHELRDYLDINQWVENNG